MSPTGRPRRKSGLPRNWGPASPRGGCSPNGSRPAIPPHADGGTAVHLRQGRGSVIPPYGLNGTAQDDGKQPHEGLLTQSPAPYQRQNGACTFSGLGKRGICPYPLAHDSFHPVRDTCLHPPQLLGGAGHLRRRSQHQQCGRPHLSGPVRHCRLRRHPVP